MHINLNSVALTVFKPLAFNNQKCGVMPLYDEFLREREGEEREREREREFIRQIHSFMRVKSVSTIIGGLPERN